MKIPYVQFICILSEFIEAYLAALLCNLFCISVFIPKLSGDPAVSGLSARLMSVYWARTRAEEPGSGELRPGLRVRWSLSPTVLSGLQNHFVGVYPRAHCCCSAILAPILDFCISLITRTSKGTMRKIHTSCTLNTFQTTAQEYWPQIIDPYLEYNLFLSV